MMWIALGSFDPFGVWDHWIFRTLFDCEEHNEVVHFRHFILGPFGATLSGFFVLVLGIVYFGFPQKQAWTYWTVVAGIATWFCIDCSSCVFHGAWFNILIVNIPCIIVLGIPLAGLRNSFATPNSR